MKLLPKLVGSADDAWLLEWTEALAEMDVLIQSDPATALREAHKAFDYGTELLLKLIKSKKLFNPKIRPERFGDDAEICLCSRISYLIKEICKFTKTGRHYPVFVAWHDGKKLTEAVHELASVGPIESLQAIARESLFMPSLRSKHGNLPRNFKKIAEKIQLSDDCAINTEWKAKYQLDASPTRFVAQIVEYVADWRRDLEERRATLLGLKKLADTNSHFREFKNLSLKDYLCQTYRHKQVPILLVYLNLPTLTLKTSDQWWKKAIKPYIEDPETLDRLRGTLFYNEILQAVGPKDYLIVDELKRRCEQVFKSKTFFKQTTPLK